MRDSINRVTGAAQEECSHWNTTAHSPLDCITSSRIESEFIISFKGYYKDEARDGFISAALKTNSCSSSWHTITRSNPIQHLPSDFSVVHISREGNVTDCLSSLSRHPLVKLVTPHRKFSRSLSCAKSAGTGGGVGRRRVLEERVRDNKRWVVGRRLLRAIPRQITSTLHANVLWTLGHTGKNIKVAVFDTGLPGNHPHFRHISDRTDWTDEKTMEDHLGHGTFVAGVIASSSECLGFAPDSELFIFAYLLIISWFLDAFNYAILKRIDVLNLSIGGPDFLDQPFIEKVWELTYNGVIMKDLTNLKELFLCLEKALDNIDLNPDKNECIKPGSYIFDYLGESGVTVDTYGILLDQCSQAISSLTSDQALHRSGSYIQKFVDAIKIVFLTSCPRGMGRKEMASLHYRVYLKSETNKRKRSNTWTDETSNEDIMRKICYWCFNPGHAMSELIRQGVRSVILTSGTLSPLASFTSELQLDFPVSLQGSHVIGQDQVWVGVVSKGCDNARLNSSYQYRFTSGYMDSLGNTLVNFFRIIPDGILVFFPSYVVMETLVAHWKEGSNIFSRMEQYKQIFKEPRYKTEFNSVMAALYEKINSPSSTGGAFFGVCRGKVNEGLDFANANGWAVIITGLHYPPRGEPKVQLKMEYLRDAKTSDRRSELITDLEWYSQQATRAVNQAIGRVIRHRSDYGAIILCNERFSYSRSQDELPLWLRPQVQKYEKFGLV